MGGRIDSIDWMDAIRYILNESFRSPGDSIRDIANEAFEQNALPLTAVWSDDIDEYDQIELH